MKSFILFALLTVCFAATAETQTEEASPLDGSFSLVEYYFETVEGNLRPVHCTEEEILDGLVGNIFSSSQNNLHKLEPSEQPSYGKGSWLVSQESCPSQSPFYNGVGFEYLNKNNGEAIVYIAGFNREPAKNEGGISGFAIDVHRGYNIVNKDSFNAHCEFQGRTIPLVGSKVLVCTLEGDEGFLKFIQD